MICPIVMFWLIKSCLFLFEFIESVEIRVIYFPINLFMNECKIIMKKISLFIVCVIILFCVYVCTCEKRFLFHEFSEMTKIVFYDKINEMVIWKSCFILINLFYYTSYVNITFVFLLH